MMILDIQTTSRYWFLYCFARQLLMSLGCTLAHTHQRLTGTNACTATDLHLNDCVTPCTFGDTNSTKSKKAKPVYCFAESVDGKHSVKIGNREWIMKDGIEISERINVQMEEHEEEGETVVLVCINGR